MSDIANRSVLEVRDSRWMKSRIFQFGYNCDFSCRQRELIDNIPTPPDAKLRDLIRIASAIFFTDRIVKRDRRRGPNSWPRIISLTIEVNEPDFWSDDSTCQRLYDALNFVSGDDWGIRFVPSTSNDSKIEWQQPLDSSFYPSNPRLCLYSGGLDSAAGLAHQLSLSENRPIVPITIRHRSDLGNKVNDQISSLGRLFGQEIHSVVVPFEMRSPSKLALSEETSQRSRAFLFTAIGAVVSDGFGMSELEMFESGVGAINAPLLAGMEGSQATRGSHPHFLHLMSEFLTVVFGRPFRIVLPFLNSTKGELVTSLSRAELQCIANSTCSCPSFPVRVRYKGPQQSCGICAACLFRRLALQSAGIGEKSTEYQYDFLNPGVSIPSKKRRYLTAFLNQVDSLNESDLTTLPLSIEKHLRQTHVLEHGHTREDIVHLYRRYRNEWIGLIQQADSIGCNWTKLIDLPSKAA